MICAFDSIAEMVLLDRLDRSHGPDRHKNRRQNRPVIGFELAGAGMGPAVFLFERKFHCTAKVGSRGEGNNFGIGRGGLTT
jgi:hypothetical protein